MKKLILLGGVIIVFSRCSQDPLETNDNSGLLQSITSYGGDSAIAGFQFQKYNFNYDAQSRVNLVTYHSNNLTTESQHDVRFFYSGSDKNPYLMMDSAVNSDPGGSITGITVQKFWLFYDDNKNKIKDSSELYFRSSTPPHIIINGQNPANHEVYKYTYQPFQLLVARKSNVSGFFSTNDTFFFNNQNVNIRKGSRVIYYNNLNIDEYYDVINPVAALNISKAIFNRFSFLGVNFHPYGYDMGIPENLPKSFSGRYYDISDNQTMTLNFYFDKNTAGKVSKLVAAKRRFRYPSGILYDFYYTNYTFDYYP